MTLARICEEALSDDEKAIDRYRKALEYSADDPMALAALDRLLDKNERWEELAEILEPASLSGFVVTLGQHLLVHGSPLILPQKGPGGTGKKPPASVEAGKPSSQKPGDKK